MKFNKSVFFSFFLSYILLMSVVVSALSVLLHSSFSQQKADIRSSHENMMLRSCQTISSTLDSYTALLNEFGTESHVNSLSRANRSMDAQLRQNIITLYQTIDNTRKGAQNVYTHIAFYFGQLNMMLSNNGTCKANIFYDIYMRDFFDSQEQWLDWMNSLQSGKLYGLKDGSLCIGTVLPLPDATGYNSAMFMQLNEQNLFSPLLSAQDLFKGVIEVYTPEGDILYTIGDAEILNGDTGESLYHFEVPDAENRFVLKCSIEEDTLFANADESLRLYTGVSLLIIVFGTIVSLFMSMRFYRPVKRITSMVSTEKDRNNEFERIEKSIQSIIDERERLNSTLIHHSSDLLESEFRLAVSGEASEDQMNDLIARELRPEESGLISILLVGFEGHRKDACVQLEAQLTRYTRARCFRIGRLVAGIAVEADPENMKSHLREVFQQLCAVCPGSLLMAVSDIIYTPAALAISHRQAMDVLDYGMMVYGNGLVFSDELPDSFHESDSGITLYDHMHLQDAIRSSNAEEAMRTFQMIVNKYFPRRGVPLSLLKCRMFSLMNTLVASVSGVESAETVELPVEKLLSCASVNDMIREAETYLETVCSILQSQVPAQIPNTLCDQIIDYIKAHHQDPNMNVSSIADQFQISASYLSRIFKQKTGEGLLDTIHFVRLAHVKQLLTETDMPMNDIQQLVGYPSEQTMFRAFKRLEGVTPTQFRQQHRHRTNHS